MEQKWPKSSKKEKLSSHEVYLSPEVKHLKAIQQNGILVENSRPDPFGVSQHWPFGYTKHSNSDLILLCTKSYDLNSALEAIRTRMNETTVIIPLLNGVDIYERIRHVLKQGFILPACLYWVPILKVRA